MFSVPGWNVSAPLTTQVEKPKPADPAKIGKKAQKRKRKLEEQIDAGNVGEYWEKVIGRNGVGSTSLPETKAPVAADEAANEGAREKKARKRRKKNKDADDGKDVEHVESKVADFEPTHKEPTTADAERQSPNPAPKDANSKPDKKKRKRDSKTEPSVPEPPTPAAPPKPADISSLLPEPKGLTPLQKSMRQKLASARFRHLNEALYTKPSAASLSLFESDPSMFEDYHRGFAQQVQVWPENPVDVYVSTILARGKLRPSGARKDKHRKGPQQQHQQDAPANSTLKPLPRNLKGHCTIADLGCGTASLAYRLQPHLAPLHLTLHSFDLAKPSGPSAPLVTVADIAALPLPDASVDIAIFCLALMGTNWLDFVDEAYRVLRWRGELWVAEIKSRFGRVERAKGQGPVNSVGSLKKRKKGRKGKKGEGEVKEHEEGIQGSDDEAELATRIDGVEAPAGTDVSAFTAVLLKHGFALDARPERPGDAIDMSNKMFVKLSFTKSATPSMGKNARKDGGDAKAGGAENAFGPRAAAGFQGKGGLKMGIKGKKFTAIAAEGGEEGESDAKVLKPCLYKIR